MGGNSSVEERNCAPAAANNLRNNPVYVALATLVDGSPPKISYFAQTELGSGGHGSKAPFFKRKLICPVPKDPETPFLLSVYEHFNQEEHLELGFARLFANDLLGCRDKVLRVYLSHSDPEVKRQLRLHESNVLLQTSVYSPPAPDVDLEENVALAWMEEGRTFTLHRENKRARQVDLFLRAKTGKHGTLFWNKPGVRERSKFCIPLCKVKYLYPGGSAVRSDNWLMEHVSSPVNCFVIHFAEGRDDYEVFFEAPNKDVADAFIFGIYNVLNKVEREAEREAGHAAGDRRAQAQEQSEKHEAQRAVRRRKELRRQNSR
eukprot:CAMPEP_0175127596 /NCGR_PEP_ID=MMETSP0087-20121206/4469_1 /TAXON_ID=136419 /ORGANISM="Unknown Unknown, Strain D1" /LENGTH=317 /DNA_ID=CAMNT_0016409581 /DNA_START=73 /DNA_END=1023 /DNA_ORIENTATION=+